MWWWRWLFRGRATTTTTAIWHLLYDPLKTKWNLFTIHHSTSASRSLSLSLWLSGSPLRSLVFGFWCEIVECFISTQILNWVWKFPKYCHTTHDDDDDLMPPCCCYATAHFPNHRISFLPSPPPRYGAVVVREHDIHFKTLHIVLNCVKGERKRKNGDF